MSTIWRDISLKIKYLVNPRSNLGFFKSYYLASGIRNREMVELGFKLVAVILPVSQAKTTALDGNQFYTFKCFTILSMHLYMYVYQLMLYVCVCVCVICCVNRSDL